MLLHLHPTRREALTAGESTLTRWSLATNPAAKLVQISTAPCPLFDIVYLQDGRKATYGGVTGAPDGDLFALKLFVYPVDDGALGDWVPSGFNQSLHALAFGHHGTTLCL